MQHATPRGDGNFTLLCHLSYLSKLWNRLPRKGTETGHTSPWWTSRTVMQHATPQGDEATSFLSLFRAISVFQRQTIVSLFSLSLFSLLADREPPWKKRENKAFSLFSLSWAWRRHFQALVCKGKRRDGKRREDIQSGPGLSQAELVKYK